MKEIINPAYGRFEDFVRRVPRIFSEEGKTIYKARNEIKVFDYTPLENGEIEDIFPKEKLARVIAKFLPRPEEVDEDFDDIVVEDKPVCDQIEEFAKKHEITLEQGWKVRLAVTVKRDILKGTDKVISIDDPEYERVVELFKKL